MPPVVAVALGCGGALLLLALASPWSRLRVPLSLLAALVTGVAGLATGILLPSDLWRLPGYVGLSSAVLHLLLWAAYGGLAAAAGGLWMPGPPVLGAALSGALLGELGAAGALAGIARDRAGAARLVLAAMGGAMLGRVGDPAFLLLGMGPRPWALIPLALGMIAVAAPGRAQVAAAGGSRAVTGLSVLVAGGALAWPQGLGLVLGLGALGMAVLAGLAFRALPPGAWKERVGTAVHPLAWCLGSALILVAVTAGGLPELAALGLEEIREEALPWMAPGLALCGAVLAALIDGAGASLFGLAFLDRALSLKVDEAPRFLAIGLAAGGLGPLLIAGALRAGGWRWALQLVLAVAWAWWLGG